jgi:SAM-dependent methyltransferase
MPTDEYVHGRSHRESERLDYQASRLADLLHAGTRYPPGSTVLEAACGVGAQTVILAGNSPGADFVCVDISADSLAVAEERVRNEGITRAVFQQADVYRLPFPPASFDHIFVCFLLEHLPDPHLALERLKDVLRPGGSITVIEGDHGSALFYPDSTAARAVIRCLIDLQAEMGGNALIGRELWHLMNEAGFSGVTVSPRLVYADAGTPESGEAVKNIFIAMVEGVGEKAIASGMIGSEAWDKGIRDLYRTTDEDGIFCYTFFKAVAWKEGGSEP